MTTSRSDVPGHISPELVAATPLRVEEVMTRTVVTVTANQSLQEALALIARSRFRHLVVVDTAGRPTGVLSDRDLLRCMSRESHWDSATVAGVMNPQPITARPETLLSTAAAEMLTRRINCLPVVDEEERVCGILTSTDLLRVFHRVQEWIEQVATK